MSPESLIGANSTGNQNMPYISSEDLTKINQKITSTQNTVQKIVLEFLLPQQQTEEERENLSKQIVATPFDKLPLLPFCHMVHPSIYRHFSQIRKEWCLDNKSYLDHLWSVDLFKQFTKLSGIQSDASPQFMEMKNEFAAISLRYSHIITQITIESALRKGMLLSPVSGSNKVTFSDGSEGVLCNVSKRLICLKENSLNLIELRNRTEACLEKSSVNKWKTKKVLDNLTERALKKQLNTRYQNESEIEIRLIAILEGLDCGGTLWSDPYGYRYFQEMPLGKLLPKSISIDDLEKNRQQLNTYFEMIKTGWKIAWEKKWMMALPEILKLPIILPNLQKIKMRELCN